MFRPFVIRPLRQVVAPKQLSLAATTSLTTRSYIRAVPSLFRHNVQTSFKTNVITSHQTLLRSSLLRANNPMPLAVTLGSLSHFSSDKNHPGRGNKIARGVGIAGTSALLLFGKGKYLLGALKLTKLASLGSMLVSVGTYSMFFGVPYAVGMVGLIVVHETGHALVMHSRGIPFSPMVFVPFVGATVVANRNPRDAWEEALVAFGGPVLGSVGATVVALGAQMTQSQLLFALADFGFMINLFNLLPIGILDGGRICSALSPYAGVAGLGLGGLLAYEGVISNPIFYLVLLAGGWNTFQRFYNPSSVPLNYYRITQGQRIVITGGYFGLIGALIAAMAFNQRSQKPPEVLIREQQEKNWDFRY